MPVNDPTEHLPHGSRRSFLARCLGLGVGTWALLLTTRRSTRAGEAQGEHARFAARARAMRIQAQEAGDQPYGAIVVKDGKVVGEGPSRVIVRQDPTAHAEMEAIRDAARNLGSRDLGGCILYSTSPPCRMCETAAYWANISRMYSGPRPDDGGDPGYGC